MSKTENTSGTVVLLGNANPQMRVKRDDESVGYIDAPHINQSITRVEMWEGFDDADAVEHTLSTDNDRFLTNIARSLGSDRRKYAVGVNEVEQIVGHHAAGRAPTFVYSSDPEYAKTLAEYFGCEAVEDEPTMLLTNGGRDAFHAQHLSTSAQPAAFNYMALANASTATSPAATDTTLTGEFATAGLARAQATYAHTAGTNVTTLTKTYTAVAADVAGGAVTASQIGVFNASSGGTLGYKTALNATAPFNAAGDSATVTWTDTAG